MDLDKMVKDATARINGHVNELAKNAQEAITEGFNEAAKRLDLTKEEWSEARKTVLK